MRRKKFELLESNVGKIDKVVRIALSIAIITVMPYLYYPEILEEIFVVVSVLLFSTGLVGYCPAYTFCGITTRRTSVGT